MTAVGHANGVSPHHWCYHGPDNDWRHSGAQETRAVLRHHYCSAVLQSHMSGLGYNHWGWWSQQYWS